VTIIIIIIIVLIRINIRRRIASSRHRSAIKIIFSFYWSSYVFFLDLSSLTYKITITIIKKCYYLLFVIIYL
jgi:hypothetical protein